MVDSLIFAQHRASTYDLLGRDVPIEQFPHYQHLVGKEGFREYLFASKPGRDLEYLLAKFANLAQSCRQDGIKTPITVCKREDGKELVVDGNHRASIAAFYGLDLPKAYISLGEYLGRLSDTTLRFGAPNGVPYQSLYRHGQRLLTGRRTDIKKRHEMIDAADLRGKTVLDMGCNIGAASIYAYEQGASVYSVDVPGMMTPFVRVMVALNTLATPYDALGSYDTGFFFSVHRHFNIEPYLRRCKVAYVETHEDGRLPPFIQGAKKIGAIGKRVLYRVSD